MFKRNGNTTLEGYTDADYAGLIVDRRSTTWYCTFLGGNLVTWRSKKQNVVALSSVEPEFRVMAQGIDNKSATNITYNPVQHDQTKHIEVGKHFIKEKFDSGLMICIPFVFSQRATCGYSH